MFGTRDRLSTLAADVSIRKAGFLLKKESKKSGGVVFKRYYFTLSDSSLSQFESSLGDKKIAEWMIPLSAVVLADGKTKDGIVLKSTEHRPGRRPSALMASSPLPVTVCADSSKLAEEWLSAITSISRRIREQSFFPDDLTYDTAAREVDDITSRIKSKMKRMIAKNYFELDKRPSEWRSDVSLRGLSSLSSKTRVGGCDEAPIDEFMDQLITGFSRTEENPPPAMALAVHNSANAMLVGCKPTLAMSEANCGKLELKKLVSTQNSAVSVDGADVFDDDLMTLEQHMVESVKCWELSDGVVAMDWRDDTLLVATNDNRVLYYRTDVARMTMNTEETPYDHKYQQTMVGAPGNWMSTARVNCVKLCPTDGGKSFLSVKNEWFYKWQLECPTSAEVSERASSSPLFALEWHPKDPRLFMVGGASGNVKTVDLRQLSSNPSEAVPLVFKNAHSRCVRDISWNTLVPNWVATCGDDACVRIWDLRNEHAPVKVLDAHLNSVNCVQWSRSHPELLLSGSIDRSMILWNLRVEPRYVLHSLDFMGPVTGCAFSGDCALQYFGLSTQGEIKSVKMTPEFTDMFVPYRFQKGEPERNIESLVYARKLKESHQMIAEMAEDYWNCGRIEKTHNVLNLASTTAFRSAIGDRSASFETILDNCSRFIPRRCVVDTSPMRADIDRMDRCKMRYFLRKQIDNGAWEKIVDRGMREKIFSHFAADPTFLSTDLLLEVVHLLQQNDYCHALIWASKISNIYAKKKMFDKFRKIALMLMYPTIYHPLVESSAADGSSAVVGAGIIAKSPSLLETSTGKSKRRRTSSSVPIHSDKFDFESMLSRRALAIFGKELNKPQVVQSNLELLFTLQRCTSKRNASELIVSKMEKRIAQQTVQRDIDLQGVGGGGDLEATKEQMEAGKKKQKFWSLMTLDKNTYSEEEVYEDSDPEDELDEMLMQRYHALAKSGGTLKALSQTVYNLYFNALLDRHMLTEFFTQCTKLAASLKGFDYARKIEEMMNTIGCEKMKAVLEACIKGTYSKPGREAPLCEDALVRKVKSQCDAMLTLVTICSTCPDLPTGVEALIPSYIKRLKQNMKTGFRDMCGSGHSVLVRQLTASITRAVFECIEEKLVPVVSFETEIDEMLKEISKFSG